MSKREYIGVGGVARRVKKQYVGVGGVARRVKKAYIGVDGVARMCFLSGYVWDVYNAVETKTYTWDVYKVAYTYGDWKAYNYGAVSLTVSGGEEMGKKGVCSTPSITARTISTSGDTGLSHTQYAEIAYNATTKVGTVEGTYMTQIKNVLPIDIDDYVGDQGYLVEGTMNILGSTGIPMLAGSTRNVITGETQAQFIVISKEARRTVTESRGAKEKTASSTDAGAYPQNGIKRQWSWISDYDRWYIATGSKSAYSRGNVKYGEVEAEDANAYPSNGVGSDGKYYVRRPI